VRPATTIGLYAGCLAAVLVAALGVGRAVGPVVDEIATTGAGHDDAMTEAGHDEGALPGLAVSDAGYTLRLGAVTAVAGPSVPLSFVIERADGGPLASYVETHTKELHLVVVRRDLTTFQHLHPTRAADGTWSVPVDLAEPGSYRVLADFRPRGLDRSLTLGADLAVDGDVVTRPLPAPATTADAGDGYAVALSGTPRAGHETELRMTVTRDGREVTDLQPYLGASGHLVALRTGDLAYLHVHPAGDHDVSEGSTAGPDVSFLTTFPTAGTYRLFLDFKVGGTVRTAAFTVGVPR
jgi:hypothetical protein